MPRLIDVLSASVLAITACNPHQAQSSGGPPGAADTGSQTMTKPTPTPPSSPPPSPPRTTLEQVQRTVPPDASVGPAGLDVPGMELFAVRDHRPPPPDGYAGGTLVAVLGGLGGRIVQGSELVRAAIAARPDARTLAHVALWASRREGEILDAARTDEQRNARVEAPAIAGGALVFWVWSTGVSRMLQLARLDLASAELSLGSPPAAQGEVVANAIAMLANPNPSTLPIAVKQLADACGDARASHALLDALARHPRPDVRRAVALGLPPCGAAAVEPLIHALEHDAATDVKTAAAKSLGVIGDGRARPALEKAAASEDYAIALIAKDALKKLK